ncbi:MAG: hypothetical protein AB1646_13140 [Thermodesulfobacteriota bacterium]
MREVLFVAVVGVVVLGIQVSRFGLQMPAAYKPDLMLVTVVWSSLRVRYATGAGYAFVAGLLVSLFSGAPTALFSLVYCLVFGLSGYVNSTFQVDRPLGWALLLFIGAWLGGGVIAAVRLMEVPSTMDWSIITWMMLKATTTVLGGELLMLVLDRLWKSYSRIMGE